MGPHARRDRRCYARPRAHDQLARWPGLRDPRLVHPVSSRRAWIRRTAVPPTAQRKNSSPRALRCRAQPVIPRTTAAIRRGLAVRWRPHVRHRFGRWGPVVSRRASRGSSAPIRRSSASKIRRSRSLSIALAPSSCPWSRSISCVPGATSFATSAPAQIIVAEGTGQDALTDRTPTASGRSDRRGHRRARAGRSARPCGGRGSASADAARPARASNANPARPGIDIPLHGPARRRRALFRQAIVSWN
jgi:hypothetical protein